MSSPDSVPGLATFTPFRNIDSETSKDLERQTSNVVEHETSFGLPISDNNVSTTQNDVESDWEIGESESDLNVSETSSPSNLFDMYQKAAV